MGEPRKYQILAAAMSQLYDTGESFAAFDLLPAPRAAQVWLRDAPRALEAAGLQVRLWPGWETRSRSSGGIDAVLGIGIHHTGSNATPDADARWCWQNSGDRPIGNIIVERSGRLTFGAAGATNTQGRGGPLQASKGTIPVDNGNRYMISVEAANTGVGEAWPRAQLEAMIATCRALVDLYGLSPNDIWTHAAYCAPSQPGRKIDPAGPTPSYPQLGGTSGAATWYDAAFRALVRGWASPLPGPAPTPPPDGDEPMQLIVNHPGYSDAFLVGAGPPLHLGPAMFAQISQTVPLVTERDRTAFGRLLSQSGVGWGDLTPL